MPGQAYSTAVKERPILFSAPMIKAILDGQKSQTRRVIKPQPTYDGLAVTKISPVLEGVDCHRTGEFFFHHPQYDRVVRSGYWCPYGKPGQRLWVRETHYRFGHWEPVPGVKTKGGRMKWKFVSDTNDLLFEPPRSFRKGRHHKDSATPAWHKRIARFMPKWASRITLEITDVRVERLNEISEADAIAEGLPTQIGDGGGPGAGYKWHGIGIHDCVSVGRFGPTYHVAGQDGICRCNEGTPLGLKPGACAYRILWEHINGKDSWSLNQFVWVLSFKRIA